MIITIMELDFPSKFWSTAFTPQYKPLSFTLDISKEKIEQLARDSEDREDLLTQLYKISISQRSQSALIDSINKLRGLIYEHK